MIDSLIKLGEDVTKVVLAPVEITADVARVVTKPVSEIVEDAVNGVKDVTRGMIGED